MDWLGIGDTDIRREIQIGYDSLYKPKLDSLARYNNFNPANNRQSLSRLSIIDENYSLGLGHNANAISTLKPMFRSTYDNLSSSALLNNTSYLNQNANAYALGFNSTLSANKSEPKLNTAFSVDTADLKWDDLASSTRDYLESPTSLFLTNPMFNANVKAKQASIHRPASNSNLLNKDSDLFLPDIQANSLTAPGKSGSHLSAINNGNNVNYGIYSENYLESFQMPRKGYFLLLKTKF